MLESGKHQCTSRCMHKHTQAYSGGRGDMSIPVLGTLDVLPKYDGQETTLPMLVVKREGSSLLGRNWLTKLRLNWHEIFWLHNTF